MIIEMYLKYLNSVQSIHDMLIVKSETNVHGNWDVSLQNRMSEYMPDRMPERMSEYTYARKNVR